MSAASPHSSGLPASVNEADAYQWAIDYVFNRLNFERVAHDSYQVEDFRLSRMQRLLELLGNPHLQLPIVHVAGTKGKGSTSAMLASMLQAAGLKVGLFTSPHLTRFEERFTVNKELARPGDLVERVKELHGACEQLVAEMPPGPTYFELTTALAWLHFKASGCDIAVIEVGLGGRLDSTNLCAPLCSIVTSISRDHTRLLGETLPEIAAEKAGIIKRGVPSLSGVADEGAAEVIRKTAEEHQSTLSRIGCEIRITSRMSGESTGLPYPVVDLVSPYGRHSGLACPLPGSHQAANLALAVTAFDLLSSTWKPLPAEAVGQGLRDVSWPLRIEQLSESPRVIVDTAHNDASIRALCETLAPLKHGCRRVVFATSRDKEAASMLAILSGAFDEIILTRYQLNPRALPLDALSELAGQYARVPWRVAETPAEAWRMARELSSAEDLICVTGSVFLAAEMRSVILNEGQ